MVKRAKVVRGLTALLSVSGASILRAMLGGLNEGMQSLRDTYTVVSPLSPLRYGPARKLLKRIPEVSLADAAPLPEELVLDLRYAEVDGAAPYLDLLAILRLAMERNPEGVLEFGTYFGSTTKNLALNLPKAQIHTIDLPPDAAKADELTAGKPVDDLHLIQGRQLGKSFQGSAAAAKITQHLGDTASYDYRVIPDALSFFLIDGSHTYEYAKSDTLKSFSVARGESTFVWHDCDEVHPGVTRWLVEMIDAGLPVFHVRNTYVAFMKLDAGDERIQKFLR